jgi:hypothetical protein
MKVERTLSMGHSGWVVNLGLEEDMVDIFDGGLV